jgi:hypothetical protein
MIARRRRIEDDGGAAELEIPVGPFSRKREDEQQYLRRIANVRSPTGRAD